MTQHKHSFKLVSFEENERYCQIMYLYCKCGAVEKVSFTNYNDCEILIKIEEPNETKQTKL